MRSVQTVSVVTLRLVVHPAMEWRSSGRVQEANASTAAPTIAAVPRAPIMLVTRAVLNFFSARDIISVWVFS